MSDGWNIIKNNDDIEYLLEEYCGFHDSCICKVDYVSGTSVNEDGAMTGSSAEAAKLNVNFQSQMVLKTLQLQFIGLRRINLIGYEENYLIFHHVIYLCIKDTSFGLIMIGLI